MLPRLAVAALLLGLTGCSGSDPAAPTPSDSPSSAPATRAAGGTIALLMPGPPSMRREAFDRRRFTAAVTERCPACTVDFYDAQGDPGTQSQQVAEAAAGARVIVIDAVEPLTVANPLRSAQELGVKVVGYDTLLDDLDAYVAYDRDRAGELQARALLRAAGGDGNLVVVNGSPADAGAVQVKVAAHRVLDASDAAVVGEYDALPGRPRALRTWLSTILTFFPPDTLGGVYAADDRIAGTVVRALDGAPLPVTGAGATLAGVRRVVTGRQLMTVYRPVRPAAEETARVAVAALTGADPGESSTTLDDVPAYLLEPVPVTRRNLEETVVADGYWTADEICTRRLRAACDRAGLG